MIPQRPPQLSTLQKKRREPPPLASTILAELMGKQSTRVTQPKASTRYKPPSTPVLSQPIVRTRQLQPPALQKVTVQRKVLSTTAVRSSHSIHSRSVVQLAQQQPTQVSTSPSSQTALVLPPQITKEQRRLLKAHYLMENQSKTLNKEADVGLHVKQKVCSTEPIRLKVLILSDATPRHMSKYSGSNLKTLSEGFAPEHFEVTPTYYHDPQIYDVDEVLPSPWHKMDLSQPTTFPPEQFELILGRHLICNCHPQLGHTCGGIPTDDDKAALTTLSNLATKLSTKKGSRAILTVPMKLKNLDWHKGFWGKAINEFNSSQTSFVALEITSQLGFYGIKIKPRKM